MQPYRPAAAVFLMAVLSATLQGGQAGRVENIRNGGLASGVTEANLESPNPADWLNWRGTRNGWGYSPLDEIRASNAGALQLVWSRMLYPGVSEAAPLVSNGIMYVPQSAGVVLALDARTGDLLWEYAKQFETSPDVGLPSRMRSLAIYGDTIYVPTPDAHIVALDARTGHVAWDHTVADYKLGYRYTSGPLVARGKIIAGITGCERYKDDVCFISAHDPESGRELWRTSTIARPGDPGGDTWGDLPLSRRAGGDAWIPGSYDSRTNLVYWSVAQAKPWARISRRTDGDALYTNSTLALDPDTGKIVWYRQFVPGETHDQDEVFESVLVDHAGRQSLFKMGKLGILWEVDRVSGKFIAAHDLGYQTLVDVDTTTGALTYRPGMLPKAGEELEFCPDIQGVRNWRATAYNPGTRALYIPIHPACQKAVVSDKVVTDNVGNFSWYGKLAYTGFQSLPAFPHPKSPEFGGYLIAMSLDGDVLWRHPMRTKPTSAALTTAGGIVVTADADRYLYIDDARTGKIVFQTRLPAMVHGFPVSYAVNGRQFLAVPTGASDSAPAGVNAVYVFALPERTPLSR
jgi:alcohol dehydrogenase (cytochrome c)